MRQVMRLLDLKTEKEEAPKKQFGRRMKRARPRKGCTYPGAKTLLEALNAGRFRV